MGKQTVYMKPSKFSRLQMPFPSQAEIDNRARERTLGELKYGTELEYLTEIGSIAPPESKRGG
jgi:hypothetical protein